MNKGGKLVMPAPVSDNGRQAAIAAGNANAEAHQNMLEQFGGSDGATELSVDFQAVSQQMPSVKVIQFSHCFDELFRRLFRNKHLRSTHWWKT